jgi:UDP-GlcNAc:undecaprenyl-phosphate/decaprenyl-phosphate GlcNAc-1-phosphate transferase
MPGYSSFSLLLVHAAFSFSISFLFFPVLIKLLTKWDILDSGPEHRIHSNFKPSMGGVSILLGSLLSLLIKFPLAEWISLKYFFIGLGLMFFIGLRDDVLALNPKQKLYSQFLPIFVLVLLDGSQLNSFYGLFDLPTTFPEPVSWSITVIGYILITNAYNLIDGVDGLAGAIGVIVMVCFGSWFAIQGNTTLSLIAFSFTGALVAFLVFNWQPSKIFMGDTGALMVGLILAYFAVYFINMNFSLPENATLHFRASVSTAICVLIIPVFDTVRVIILRIRKMQSPLKADHNHLHHQFLNLGFSHAKTVLVISGINLFFIFLAWILKEQKDGLILALIVVLCLGINFVLKRLQPREPIKEYGREN